MNVFEKKLTEISNETLKGQEEIITDARLLLEQNANDERNTLKAIGLDRSIRYVEKRQEDMIIRSTEKDKYDREIVHINDINKLLLKYRLYMKKAYEFIGEIPNELGAELTRFCKENNVVQTGHSSYSNFYVIAPPIMFASYQSPLAVLKNAMIETYREQKEEERIRKMKLDPILLYKIPNNEDYYVIVKSWGDDFTFLRRIYGFFTQENTMKVTNQIVKWSLTFLYIYTMIAYTKYAYVKSNATTDGLFTFLWAVSIIVFDIGTFVVTLFWLFSKYWKAVREKIIDIVTRYNPEV